MNRRFPTPPVQIAILLAVYLVSRLYNLLLLPMVYDEAIYLRWATIIHSDPAKALISALDGKPPLFFMLNALTLAMTDDLLFSARILSVLAGALTLLGLYALVSLLYSFKTAFTTSWIYLSLPYSLIHDRLGLVDSLLTACVVATILFSILIVKFPEYYKSMAFGLGAALGLGFLTKTPHLIFWIYPPLVFLLLGNRHDRRLWQGLGLAGLVFLLLAIPYLLHDPPQASEHSSKILHHQIDLWGSLLQTLTLDHPRLFPHLAEFASAAWTYVTWPILGLFLLGTMLSIMRRERPGLLWVAWIILPPIPFLIFGEVAYARYLLIIIPPMALLAALGWEAVWKKLGQKWPRAGEGKPVGTWVAVSFLLIPAWMWNTQLLTNPVQAAWTPLDHWQYVRYAQGPTAVQESVHYFKQQAKEKPIIIFLTAKPGIPGDALYLYLKEEPNITISDSWYGPGIPQALETANGIRLSKSKYEYPEATTTLSRDTLTGKALFFVANPNWFKPDEVLKTNPRLKIVRRYKDIDPSGFFSFHIYQMDPLLPAP